MRPLADRTALVTGVSRRAGIGAAIARRLVADGARVLTTGWRAHDAAMPWGADATYPAIDGAEHREADLADADAPRRLVDEAVRRYGRLDVVVANHARSSAQTLAEITAAELDRSWAVNVRATLLLAQAFAAARPPGPGGRLILLTSGQGLGPMPGELPYVATKGALEAATATLADELMGRGVTVNAVNPGPVDTGWADPEASAALAARFPIGRWGTPDDAARLVAWLASDEAAWVTGQTLHSEGGFRR